VALTAARGRGKSAALGLAVASAVAYGYSNMYVTSPTPENLKTLFEFILKGLDSLGYVVTIKYNPLFTVQLRWLIHSSKNNFLLCFSLACLKHCTP